MTLEDLMILGCWKLWDIFFSSKSPDNCCSWEKTEEARGNGLKARLAKF
jgi:hypothetical protein